MGCWNSKGGGDSSENRIARWRSTGIVALRDSKLRALPGDILVVDAFVRTLDLTNNKITELSPDISRFVNLQRLILANNQLQQLPTTIGVLRSLKVLILDGNQITSLPDELGSLSRLEKLSIIGNSLICLPKNIGDLRNNLASIPHVNFGTQIATVSSISARTDDTKTVQLSLLNVSRNKLKSLPESIGGCISLEELQANGNLIEELPSSVGTLIHLKFISLNNNLISQLPQNLLMDCRALQNVSLHDNPISMDQFQQMEGFQEFEERRKRKFDKQIDSNVIMSSKGLDEGIDV